jgi:bacillithiol system protein YtxJ
MTPVNTPEAFQAWRARPGITWLFKHSTACPVSAAAHAEVTAYEKANPRDAIGLVLVIEKRATSDLAAKVLGVEHRSPQLFLLRDGKVVWHASHDDVNQAAMELQRLPVL